MEKASRGEGRTSKLFYLRFHWLNMGSLPGGQKKSGRRSHQQAVLSPVSLPHGVAPWWKEKRSGEGRTSKLFYLRFYWLNMGSLPGGKRKTKTSRGDQQAALSPVSLAEHEVALWQKKRRRKVKAMPNWGPHGSMGPFRILHQLRCAEGLILPTSQTAKNRQTKSTEPTAPPRIWVARPYLGCNNLDPTKWSNGSSWLLCKTTEKKEVPTPNQAPPFSSGTPKGNQPHTFRNCAILSLTHK